MGKIPISTKVTSMMKYLKKLRQKISTVAIIMLLLQIIMPSFAAANISKLNQLSAADGIIAICSGFEIKYIRIDEDGKATIVDIDDLPQNMPDSFVHCDNCIVSDSSILPNLLATHLPVKLHAHIKIAATQTVISELSPNLPPVRAPPYI